MKSNGVEPIYGDLPDTWDLVSLGSLIDLQKAELMTGPFGTMLHASAYRPAGTPVVAVQHIGENRLKHVDLPRVDDDTVERLQRYKLKQGDILFGRKGAVERRAIIRQEEEGWLEGSDCIRLRFFDEKISAEFVSYVLGSSAFKDWIMRHAGGATMPSLNQTILRLLPLPLPPKKEQENIARILGALDDKIELNRRMNHTLEEMARAIFKSWFVDFDPVTAKAEGRVPFGMNAETASLFPAEFEDVRDDAIPTTWEVGSILDFANLLSGGTPSTQKPEYWDGTIAWVSAKDVSSANGLFVLSTERSIAELGLKNSSAKLLPAKTTIVTARGTVGKYCILGREMAMNQTNYGLRAKDGASNYFTYFSLVFLVEQLQQNSYGTIFDTITTRTFQDSRTIIPSKPVIDAFEKRVTPLMNMILDNALQVQTLTSIRDSLLPKLLSGELRAKQAEKVIENT